MHRTGDAAGVAAFAGELAAGATLEQVEAQMIASPEYLQTRGQSATSGFLDAVYQDILNRPIDSAGLAAYAALAGEGTDGRLQVIDALFDTTEYRQDLVTNYYLRVLDRTADSAGLDFYVAELEQRDTRRTGHRGLDRVAGVSCAAPRIARPLSQLT